MMNFIFSAVVAGAIALAWATSAHSQTPARITQNLGGHWAPVPIVSAAIKAKGHLGGEGAQWPRFASRDGGATWTPAKLDNSLVMLPGNARQGLFQWHPRNADLDGGREAICVRVHPKTREAWVSTSCYVLWKWVPDR